MFSEEIIHELQKEKNDMINIDTKPLTFNKTDLLGDDEEFEKFIEGINLEQRMGGELVFYQSNTYLNNATSISQHILPDRWISTIIGESHMSIWSCPTPNISVSEYIRSRVLQNDKCLVMLEYDNVVIERGVSRFLSDAEVLSIESQSLRDTFRTLRAIGKTDKIYPYDRRSRILGARENNALYQTLFSSFFGGVNLNDAKRHIMDLFIEPFFASARNNWFDIPVCLEVILCQQLEQIRGSIEMEFRDIANNLNSGNLNLDYAQKRLQFSWQRVTDFLVLKDMYSRNDVNEYIFVGGEYHSQFMISKLNEVTVVVDTEKGKVGNCLNLYHLYKFE